MKFYYLLGFASKVTDTPVPFSLLLSSATNSEPARKDCLEASVGSYSVDGSNLGERERNNLRFALFQYIVRNKIPVQIFQPQALFFESF